MINFYILIGVLALVIYLTIKGRNNNYFISENNSNMSVGFSYGATLVSTSAIVGFGGLGWLGYSVFTLLFALSLSTFFAIRYIGPRIYRLNQKHKQEHTSNFCPNTTRVLRWVRYWQERQLSSFRSIQLSSSDWYLQVHHE